MASLQVPPDPLDSLLFPTDPPDSHQPPPDPPDSHQPPPDPTDSLLLPSDPPESPQPPPDPPDSPKPPPDPMDLPDDLLFLRPFLDFQLASSLALPADSLFPEAPHALLASYSAADASVCSPPQPELWASKFKNSLRNLKKSVSPSFSDDGTPTVQAPPSILLSNTQIWKDHIIAKFHRTPPSTGKIFADLNPIWGKQGRIAIKHYSETVCLIFVPCVDTRDWVLEVGFWQSGNCSFSTSIWSPTADLSPSKLVSAPTWVVLRHVPPQLHSLPGLSVIASGVGEPLHTEHSKLNPYSNGIVKVKVEVDLTKKLPRVVRVADH